MQSLWQWKSYYIIWVRVCSLSYRACIVQALHCHLWPVQLSNIFPHYLISSTNLKKVTEHKMCVLIFITNFSEIFLFLRRTGRDIIVQLYWCSCAVLSSTVHYCAVLCSTVQYCAVLCSTVEYCAVLCSTVLYCAVLYSTHHSCQILMKLQFSWHVSQKYSNIRFYRSAAGPCGQTDGHG